LRRQVFWLAVNAVQRYVLDHKSYTHAFSDELTPRGVLAEDLQVDHSARARVETRACEDIGQVVSHLVEFAHGEQQGSLAVRGGGLR